MADIREALEAFDEALEAWASKLCAMPSIAERKRLDAARKARAALADGGWRPNWAGQFNTFDKWVSGAPKRLDRFAVCIDAKGRRCFKGADFMRARDENAFPVRYFWDCQPPESA